MSESLTTHRFFEGHFTDSDTTPFATFLGILEPHGDIPQVAEGAAYPQSLTRELGTVTYTSVEYKRKFGITALMDDFSNYGTTMKTMKKIMKSGLRTSTMKPMTAMGRMETKLCISLSI